VPEEKDSFSLIDAASDLLGGLAAGVTVATISHDISGLLGGSVGVGVAHTLRYGAKLFVNRFLAHREKARVGLVYGLAAVAIQERLEHGDTLRTDDFFDRDITDRSKSDEIVEAILIAAQRESQEKKLPYLANLLAFIAFESRIDVGMANYMIKTASSLTYRQYCLLEVARNPHDKNLRPASMARQQQQNASQVFAALMECYELYRLGLVKFQYQIGLVAKIEDMDVSSITLNGLGPYLHLAMKLDTIPSEDIASTVALLR